MQEKEEAKVVQVPMGFLYISNSKTNDQNAFLKTKNLFSCIALSVVTFNKESQVEERLLIHIGFPVEVSNNEYINTLHEYINKNLQSLKTATTVKIDILESLTHESRLFAKELKVTLEEKFKNSLNKNQQLQTNYYKQKTAISRYNFVVSPNGKVYISLTKNNSDFLATVEHTLSASEKNNPQFVKLAKEKFQIANNGKDVNDSSKLTKYEKAAIYPLTENDAKIFTTHKTAKVNIKNLNCKNDNKKTLNVLEYEERLQKKEVFTDKITTNIQI